jgi:hypothetical protein
MLVLLQLLLLTLDLLLLQTLRLTGMRWGWRI